MFKSIVVGTDGSERASEAVLRAAELAATQPGCVLHIVTVQKPLSPSAVAAGEMAAVPASPHVNSARNEGPACLPA